jgi:hypothetical protein
MKRAPFITLALIVSTTLVAVAGPLWPPREAKSLAKPERGGVNAEGKTEKDILADRAVLRANMQANAPTELYRANEFQFDVFASGSAKDLDQIVDGHRAGFGLGVNYFFTPRIGVGAEFRHVMSRSENFGNQESLNLILRQPVGPFAFYGLAGVGIRYQNHNVDPRFSVGGGAEYRFNPRLGAIVEAKVVSNKIKAIDDNVVKVGFRLPW